MLNALCLGALWGATIGKFFSISPNLFECLRVILVFSLMVTILTFSFFLKGRSYEKYLKQSLLMFLSACWTVIHNPETLSVARKEFQVLWSPGCSDMDRDLLIHDGFQIYLAHGLAETRDKVMMSENPFAARRSRVETTISQGRVGQICSRASGLRSILYRSLDKFPRDMRSWFSGFALGRNTDVDQRLLNSFRNVGLLHVIVLSGGHLSTVAGMILLILRLPFHVPYLFQKLSVNDWLVVWNVTTLISVFLLFLFCSVVGFSPTVQRAFLSFLVCNVFTMVGVGHRPKTRIKLVFCLQALIFPVNLISISLLLSWTGALLLQSFYESTYLKTYLGAVLQAAKIQLLFLGTTLVFFGQAGILSPLVNLLALLIFGFLLSADLLGILFGNEWLNTYLITWNRLAIDWVRWLDYVQDSLLVSYLRIPKILTMHAVEGRVLLAFLISLFYLLTGLRQQDQKKKSRNPRKLDQALPAAACGVT